MASRKNGSAPERAAERPRRLIEHYEEIARASREMLRAAQAGDWVEVDAIEQRCRDTIAALKRASAGTRLAEAENRRRLAILRSILKDDAEIRLRAEPWLRDLESLLSGAPATRGS